MAMVGRTPFQQLALLRAANCPGEKTQLATLSHAKLTELF